MRNATHHRVEGTEMPTESTLDAMVSQVGCPILTLAALSPTFSLSFSFSVPNPYRPLSLPFLALRSPSFSSNFRICVKERISSLIEAVISSKARSKWWRRRIRFGVDTSAFDGEEEFSKENGSDTLALVERFKSEPREIP